MKRALLLVVLAVALATIDLLPLALILKQAFTPEHESFSWPPTWIPHAPTLESFRTLSGTIELGNGLWLSGFVALLTVISSLGLTLPAAWLAARHPRTDRTLDAAMVV